MKAEVVIKIDAMLKQELINYAESRKQNLSDLIVSILSTIVKKEKRDEIKISPYIMDMTSDLSISADLNAMDAFIEAMENKNESIS